MKNKILIIILVFVFLLGLAGQAGAITFLGGSEDGYDSVSLSSGDVINFSSAGDQSFQYGDAATAIAVMTIEQEVGQAGAGINVTDDIRVIIPASVDMTWDATDTTAAIGGAASAKVSTTVSYEDLDKTLVIAVGTTFADGDVITVSGLSFDNFNAAASADNLELEIDNAGTAAALDTLTVEITLAARTTGFLGGNEDGYAAWLIAQEVRWDAEAGTGEWNDAENWDSDRVPLAIEDVIVDDTYLSADATITATATDIVYDSFSISSAAYSHTLDLSVNASGGAVSIGTSGAIHGGAGTITCSGDWNHENGTFTAETSTVTLNGTSQSVSGDNSFYDLIKAVAAADTLTFDNTSTQTVTHSLTLQGAAGQLLSLRSDSNGVQYSLTVNEGKVYSLEFLDIKDCDASGGRMLDADKSVNSQNNSNITFDAKSMF